MDSSTVTLTIPGDPGYLRLARLAAADLGSRAGMTIEEIDDLRIGVDELTHPLLQGSPVTLRFAVDDHAVVVEGSAPGVVADEPTELARTIVAAVVDEHGPLAGSDAGFRLVKRARGT